MLAVENELVNAKLREPLEANKISQNESQFRLIPDEGEEGWTHYPLVSQPVKIVGDEIISKKKLVRDLNWLKKVHKNDKKHSDIKDSSDGQIIHELLEELKLNNSYPGNKNQTDRSATGN